MKITWLGHASFRIETSKGIVVYIDPKEGDEEEYTKPADIILVSRNDYRHLGMEQVRKITLDSTVILAEQGAAYECGGNPISPGQVVEAGEVKVKAVESYNEKQGIARGSALGFIISADDIVVYFAGSSGLIPEMSEIICDIALIPVSAAAAMSAKEAAQAASALRPKIAIPMHYGTHGGSLDDAELFKEIVESESETKVVILEQAESFTPSFSAEKPAE